MHFTILNVANKAPTWILDAATEYLKRINHGKYLCKIIEIKPERCTNKSAAEVMSGDAKKIMLHIPRDSYIVALDERGKNFTSVEFANFIEHTAVSLRHIAFIIGGADGIAPELKAKCHLHLSLSKMVFPHMLVRIILLEQIYRAISILENHPYHRE